MFTLDYSFAHASHWHNDIEFGLITKGELQFNINGNDIKLKSGQGVFVNSKQIHHAFSVGRSEWEGVVLIFSPLLLCTNEQIERELINPVINNRDFTYAVLSDETPWTSDVFRLVEESCDMHARVAEPLGLQSIFCKLWALLYNNMPQESSTRDTACDYNISTLKEMIAFIHGNYTGKVTLSDICTAGSVCRSKCGVLFKKYLHQSPMDYLTAHRLRKAAAMLSETSEPMNEIAAAVGFAGASYFAETFRKYYNCTPKEYRESRTSG
jgi:AraC-like DNA-binding protein